jgi:alanyl-tRNA synthetase
MNMQKMGLNEIREKYLSFFESKAHLRLPGFSLIPDGDASLLLINSGMAPMKPYFSGEAKPPAKRITTCQKCVRVIDIDVVGKTSRHCTFFEMLGHFSFGDYFKREAITWTWEFFTITMGLDPELLYCSVYLDDDEAWDIWTREIGIPESHMVRLGKEDNFWDVGSGPCGPCSEIYYDRGEKYGCGSPGCKVGCDCDRFVEVGNNVFTQFNNDGKGNYTELSQKNIDFGMGLERLACVVQGVESVFETDTITRIRQHVSEISGVAYRQSEKTDVSLRIITDHIRSTVMLICDGVQPSNEKRGYVLRRLLRRAARHGRLLGISKPFLCDLAETVIKESREAYPELHQRAEIITKVIRIEEERFSKTIDAGLNMLRGEIGKTDGRVFSGDAAFLLYDTYGFPIDLTLEILEEDGLRLDRERFDELMEAQRQRARDARAEMSIVGWEKLGLDVSKIEPTEFVGYDTLICGATVLAAQENVIVLDKTPFYAESGGQCSDVGTIGPFRVDFVKKTPDGKILHIGEATDGGIAAGQTVAAAVDTLHREAVKRAHSATHLLQQALRGLLGGHVEQAGSQVTSDRLRFDYTHFHALTDDELKEVNTEVNKRILQGLAVGAETMPLEQAKKRGAMALFGEKYGESARVVTMGDYSLELCGGTHLDNTAKAGSFHILSDSSIAAGVRRIEAVTGLETIKLTERAEACLKETAEILKTPVQDLKGRASDLVAEQKRLQKEVAALQSKLAGGLVDDLLNGACEVNGFTLITAQVSDPSSLRETTEKLRDKDPKTVAVLYTREGDKLSFCAACGPDAVKHGIKAGDVVKTVAVTCGGNGGGRPDIASAGGKLESSSDDSCLNTAFGKVKEMLL